MSTPKPCTQKTHRTGYGQSRIEDGEQEKGFGEPTHGSRQNGSDSAERRIAQAVARKPNE
jgi:hypothetical protein